MFSFMKSMRTSTENPLLGKDTAQHDDPPSLDHNERLVLSPIMHGYRVLYLGNVPAETSSDPQETALCVERILDACNICEMNIRDAFINVHPYHLTVYFVDSMDKVIQKQNFDLARISFCTSGVNANPRIFAWNYQQETDRGFQMECHAVSVNSHKRAKLLAGLLGEAFAKFNQDFHAALRSSSLFQAAFAKKLLNETFCTSYPESNDDSCFADNQLLLP